MRSANEMRVCLLVGALLAASCGGDDSMGQGAGGSASEDASSDQGGGASGGGGTDTDGGSGAAGSGGSFGTDGAISCLTYSQTCTSSNECCSNLCDPRTHACAAGTTCSGQGTPCAAATDCCTLACQGGVCSGTACISDGQACTDGASCCGGTCTANVCQPVNPGGTCKTGGNTCGAGTECCSHLCTGGTCDVHSSYCTQTGDVCARDEECCGGICKKASGAPLGACAVPTSGSSRCSGSVDGNVCNGCGDCCSRVCAPYATTGTKICQPANGCRINGDLCRKDTDCCGGPGTDLPGHGDVTCVIENGEPVGVCRNPSASADVDDPEGDVCHYKEDPNYTCVVSSAPNNCCGAPGNSGVCKLDALGVPRCYGYGATCRNPGETCAYSGDCCNNIPCVPDANGALHCLVPTSDAGAAPVCVAESGNCTVTADCCRGLTCVSLPGSTQGTCVNPTPPPPPDGGAAGSAGTDGSAGTGGSPPPSCALYGQACTMTSDCCNTDLGVDCIAVNGSSFCVSKGVQ
jgi:hypothetical protein